MRRSIGPLVALVLSSLRVSVNAESLGAALNHNQQQGQNLPECQNSTALAEAGAEPPTSAQDEPTRRELLGVPVAKSFFFALMAVVALSLLAACVCLCLGSAATTQETGGESSSGRPGLEKRLYRMELILAFYVLSVILLTFGFLMCVDQDASLLKNLGRSIHTQLVIMCIPLLFVSIVAINRGEHKERFFVIGGYELTAMHVFVGSLSLLVGFLAAAAFKLARCPPWCHGAFLGVWYLTMMYTLPATNPWLKAIQDAMWNPASLARKLARKLQ